MGLFEKLKEERTDDKGMPWGGYDFSKPSLAVVACDEDENALVLWAVGGHIKMEQEEVGLWTAEELGLTPPKPGIWVWEGKYVWSPGPWEHPQDGDMNPVGEWREPYEDEWENIKCGTNPWDNTWWLTKEARDAWLKSRRDPDYGF